MKKFLVFTMSVCFLSIGYAGVFQTSMEQPVLIKKTSKTIRNDSKTLLQYFETTCEIWANKVVIKRFSDAVKTTETRTFSIDSEANAFEQKLKASLEGPRTLIRPSTNTSGMIPGMIAGEEITTTYHVGYLEDNQPRTTLLFETTYPLGSGSKNNSAAANFLIEFLNIHCSSN
ncbi:MAG: hypothetical protein Q7K43_03605 [Candidatus Woesearchaeota archaeon]|nr:hypothetical protein [Candidatus Woesearchaeota archaeon]